MTVMKKTNPRLHLATIRRGQVPGVAISAWHPHTAGGAVPDRRRGPSL